jgi:DNA-binding transcriptional MerR regulator
MRREKEGALRMWERRHGFPVPERLPSGHRRYRESDVERVLQVVRERAAGLALPAAIARAKDGAGHVEASVFAGLRRQRPELQPIRLRKPMLLALSRAIEDESCARAELAVVFADFAGVRRPSGGPVELPIEPAAPLQREWALVCEAPGHAVCLAGAGLTPARRPRESAREFDVIWSVEPDVVRTASEICLALASRADARLAERFEERPAPPVQPPADQLRLAAAITTRTLSALG